MAKKPKKSELGFDLIPVDNIPAGKVSARFDKLVKYVKHLPEGTMFKLGPTKMKPNSVATALKKLEINAYVRGGEVYISS